MMKTLIVYYSLEGNTEYVARAVASALGADLLRLEPVKAYPTSGFRKFFWGGKSAVMAEKPELQPYTFQPEIYDRIIFGFPVWAGNVAPPLHTFVQENLEAFKGKRIAAFACQSGSGAEKALRKLKAYLDVENMEAELVLIDPKAKPSPENEKRIKAFCDRLL
jgi:flavodoxin